LFNSELEACEKIIEDLFEIKDIDKKATSQPAFQFDYMSDHYVATLPKTFSGPRYDRIKEIPFEIQIRTIATHAWATISHYLDYRSENAIPSHLRRDFYALNALFYIADSHFELFAQASQETRELTFEKSESGNGIGAEEINLDTFSAYLKRNHPDRLESSANTKSVLIEELVGLGYTTISELHVDVQKAQDAFRRYEIDHPPASESKKFRNVGVVRISLQMVSQKFREAMGGPDDEFAEYGEFIPLIDN